MLTTKDSRKIRFLFVTKIYKVKTNIHRLLTVFFIFSLILNYRKMLATTIFVFLIQQNQNQWKIVMN